MSSISVAIATYNEEDNLSTCLSSVVPWVREIIVVDGGSSDKTVEIAKSFKAKVIVTNNPPIFHINKQKAVNACHGDWILQLDADEIVSQELASEIIQTTKMGTKAGYYISRKNYFLGHWLRKGGQYPDYVIRFFRRGKGHFPSQSVHEQVAIDGEVGYLKNPLLHYSYRTVNEYWKKAHTYITLEAESMRAKNISVSLPNWLFFTFLKPAQTFFLLFFRHKGFVDGIYGFLFALFSALHPALAYKKYANMSKEQ